MPLSIDVNRSLRTSDLPKSRAVGFTLLTSNEISERIKSALGLLELRKLRLTGTLTPHGRADWHLQAQLGATAVQSCVASAAPVVTRIDTEVERVYVADWQSHVPDDAETEMPEDDRYDPLESEINLEQLVIESLALALPDFPRSDDAAPVEMSARPPGAVPIEDVETRPFAGLADLKRKLEEDG